MSSRVFSIRFLKIALVVILTLLTQTKPSTAESLSKGQMVAGVKQCCFRNGNDILLFEQPITILLYDLSKLDEPDLSSIKSTLEILKSQAKIEFTYDVVQSLQMPVKQSTIVIVTLPNDKKELNADSIRAITNLYSDIADGQDLPVKIDGLIDYIYSGFSARVFRNLSDRQFASASFVRMNFANVYAENRVDRAVLSSLGYNTAGSFLQNSIFFSSDASEITDLDYSILKLFYENNSKHSLSFDDAIKNLH